MSSATKALELLQHFSASQPAMGLSQLCRIMKRDKATTYRHLQALETAGLVEQDPATKQYRLGPALLQLAQIREATVPRTAGAETPLSALANATGETAHVTVLSGTTLYGLLTRESPSHSIRAVIDITTFPLHATASGLCALAFGPEALFDAATESLDRYSETTALTPEALFREVEATRATGFARSNGSFEREIHSLATPIFDQAEHFAGAVAVACVASRLTPGLEATVKTQLITASRDITRNWGGTLPGRIETLWAGLPSSSDVSEPLA